LKVLIVAPNASWIGVAPLPAALARAGFTVGVVGTRAGPLAHTRYVSGRWLSGGPLDTAYKVVSLLQSAYDAWSPQLIVPADDQTVGILQRIVLGTSRVVVSNALRGILRDSLGKPEFFATILAKSRLGQAAAACSVDMPPQIVCPDRNHALEFARARGFPVLLKPDSGWAGQGIRTCRNEAELVSALNSAAAPVTPGGVQPIFSVQKFIEGETAAIGLAAQEGRLLAAIAYAKHRTTSAYGPTTVARRLQRADMLAASERLVSHFGYTGFAGIDFVIESGTDRAWMIEFNARPTPICGRAHRMGVDLAAALMADLQGKPAPAPGGGAELLAFFPQEWYRDARSPYLRDAYHDVPWDDPQLLRYFVERYPQAAVRRRRVSARVVAPSPGA
jgi:hypothetical protein